uniref:Uncharacterized protein n=1 Tax=Anguilla anguilla TaxID=7936 RepID=A0A0E9S6R5_ANGAN
MLPEVQKFMFNLLALSKAEKLRRTITAFILKTLT